MSRFQRMIVIPQEEYSHLMGIQNVAYPYNQSYQQLEQRLDESSNIRDPYSRLLHETDSLNQMRLIHGHIRNNLLLTIPKIYRSRAESLLKVIEPHMKVSERGELFDPGSGRPIENTRLDDLIQYAVSAKRRAYTPKGWIEFVRYLRKINVPKSILNRETIEELVAGDTLKGKKRLFEEEDKEERMKKVGVRRVTATPRRRITPKRRQRDRDGSPEIKQKRTSTATSRYPKDKFLVYYK